MKFLRSFCVAFSLYSKIPMPQFAWKKEDMQYQFIFFPWVGGVIGFVLLLWRWLTDYLELGHICYVLVGVAIPVLITGGFHLDGFLDTMDALHSYQSREKKLEILKDPHVGAFGIIMLAVYGLLYISAFSELQGIALETWTMGFFLSRGLSAVAVLRFPGAKRDGMAHEFSEAVSDKRKRWVCMGLYAEILLCVILMVWHQVILGLLLVGTALVTLAYYYGKTKKEFGGITGDTAGYFVAIVECTMAISSALWMHVTG